MAVQRGNAVSIFGGGAQEMTCRHSSFVIIIIVFVHYFIYLFIC